MALVTLLSDFGTADGFVGAMKGVILSLAADAQVVDITHAVPAHDVAAGAWALRAACGTFPRGTIHVGVVDPGVGSARRGLAWQRGGQVFVGPDNGLFSWVDADHGAAYALDRPELFRSAAAGARPCATFHGRDIFASVAGHLARGLPLERCGSPHEAPVVLPLDLVEVDAQSPDHQRGRVIHIDRFGNLITNLRVARSDGAGFRCALGGRDVGRLKTTFSDVAVGCWVSYLGSGATVEIAIREGDAREAGGAVGDEVTLCPLETP